MALFPFSPAELTAVTAPLEQARSLPPRAYFDVAVFEAERRSLFAPAWLCVGREEDLPQPGDWLLAPVTPAGVLVVRGPDLALRAFHNVCRHRATLLVDAPCGRAQELRCPYHGWTYELTGALSKAPFAPSGFDRAAHSLASMRVDVWQGFVFVTEGEASLEAYVLGAPPWLTCAPLAEARRAHAADYEVAANWKLLVENFQESHHFANIHPALERLTPSEGAYSRLSDGNWLGGTMELAEHAETVSTSGRRSRRPFLAPPEDRRRVSDAMLFPTLLTSLQPDYFLTYRLYPVSAERTRVLADTFVHPAALGPALDLTDVTRFWETVNAEDRAICERQQRGLPSRGFAAAPYASVEEGVHAFDVRVAKAYAP